MTDEAGTQGAETLTRAEKKKKRQRTTVLSIIIIAIVIVIATLFITVLVVHDFKTIGDLISFIGKQF